MDNISNHEQTINSIKQLQISEKKLFDQLKNSIKNGEDINHQTHLVNNINELSTSRINMFNLLNNVYKLTENDIKHSENVLKEEIRLIKVAENDLNIMKEKIDDLKEEKFDKLRIIEFNNYYNLELIDKAAILKIFLSVTVFITLISILKRFGIIPGSIVLLLVSLSIIIGSVIIIQLILKSNNHDKFIYDEIKGKQMPHVKIPDDLVNKKKEDLNDSKNNIACYNDNCCSNGLLFDKNKGQCVLDNEGTENNDHKVSNINEDSNNEVSELYKGSIIQNTSSNVESVGKKIEGFSNILNGF